MDSLYTRCSAWMRAASVIAIIGLLVSFSARRAHAQSPKDGAEKRIAVRISDFRSRHFLIHTDLSDKKAKELLEDLETMLGQISAYWGKPLKGTIECFSVCDFDNFPPGLMDPRGIAGIKASEGATMMSTVVEGKTAVVKAVVYANARPEVVLHEAVHAYCHQTFGRVGPIWYSEGMAELGHYWKDGDRAVHADDRETAFLRQNPPASLDATLSSSQVSGDGWQNYASRWSLCHFLANNPNYASQFRGMGRGILSGKDISLEQACGARARELWFEYRFFLQHIDRGYRVDLGAWDWDRKFAGSRSVRSVTANVKAGRGWQPTGLTVGAETPYRYVATGNWRIADHAREVGANGDEHGRGRLVGVLMKDYKLSEEFELSEHGSIQLPAGGDLYLRCRSDWNAIADGSGQIAVKIESGESAPKAKMRIAASAR
jgi:hypothetical protein